MLGGVAVMALLATACAHERPSLGTLQPSAANFTYFTPSTKVVLAGNFVLERCDDKAVLASSTLALVSSATANTAAAFRLDGSQLSSARQKREVSIELHENRTIKSLNATSSDRTGAIVTNVLKVVGSIAGAITGMRGLQGDTAAETVVPCNEATMAALRLAKSLRGRIATQRQALIGASAADAEKIGLQIDTLANQLALLTASRLTIATSRPIPLGDGPGSGTIRWTLKDLAKWFAEPEEDEQDVAVCKAAPGATGRFVADKAKPDDPCAMDTDILALSYSVTGSPVVEEDRIGNSPCAKPDRPAECGKTLVLAAPVPAKVEVKTLSSGILGHRAGSVLGSATVSVPQWGPATYLPLDVGLFKSRTIAFTFDQFGNRQTFKWNSEATAENAMAALVTATDAGLTAIRNLEGPTDTARWKADIEELETRMKLNKLRLCEDAIENGATKCEP